MQLNHSFRLNLVFYLSILFLLIFIASFLKGGISLDRPNVLLITVDTLRADRVSCYENSHLATPHFDGLAEQGVVFTRAFANTSTTLPSHANILLGVSPLYHGVHENQHFVVQEDFLTLAEHLRASGYSTGAFVGPCV
jgi:arylsulfatase A-like enzyme